MSKLSKRFISISGYHCITYIKRHKIPKTISMFLPHSKIPDAASPLSNSPPPPPPLLFSQNPKWSVDAESSKWSQVSQVALAHLMSFLSADRP